METRSYPFSTEALDAQYLNSLSHYDKFLFNEGKKISKNEAGDLITSIYSKFNPDSNAVLLPFVEKIKLFRICESDDKGNIVSGPASLFPTVYNEEKGVNEEVWELNNLENLLLWSGDTGNLRIGQVTPKGYVKGPRIMNNIYGTRNPDGFLEEYTRKYGDDPKYLPSDVIINRLKYELSDDGFLLVRYRGRNQVNAFRFLFDCQPYLIPRKMDNRFSKEILLGIKKKKSELSKDRPNEGLLPDSKFEKRNTNIKN
ncbi:hypothetical protein C0585_04520 [Candidatus Woesearchaeota archaeon]|nr:MAG: hypothetical protein C0585_04520 [Candidatus Woesearchaeota archaeon]